MDTLILFNIMVSIIELNQIPSKMMYLILNSGKEESIETEDLSVKEAV